MAHVRGPQALVDHLTATGAIRSDSLAEAFRRVRREQFVPRASVAQAYKDVPIGWRGESCASMPTVVAQMLEQLQVQRGHRILEIGTGTGYNAALLSVLAGPTGEVVTIEYDPSMAGIARTNLAQAGRSNVLVVASDAGLRVPGAFDRIEWTCALWELEARHMANLLPDGILVAPLILRGNLQKSISFVPDGCHASGTSATSVHFVVQRGVGDQTQRRTAVLSPGCRAWRDNLSAQSKDSLIALLATTPSVLGTGIIADDQTVLFELAAWLAIRRHEYISIEWDRSSPVASPAINLGDRVRAPLSMTFGLSREDCIVLVGLRGGGTRRAGEVVISSFGAAAGLAADAASCVQDWAASGQLVTDRLRFLNVPNDCPPQECKPMVHDIGSITKDHGTLYVRLAPAT